MSRPQFPDTPVRALAQRLGRNSGGYQGERVDIWTLLARIGQEAGRHAWIPLPLNTPPDAFLPAYCRLNPGATRNIYLSAGIHGDEPAGPHALLRLMEEDLWRPDFNYWLVPCLNPDGFERNTRENETGIDLNRDYSARTTPRVRSHIRWLEEQPAFHLSLLLHEDWESNGFYVYELNPDRQPSLTDALIEGAAQACPIDHAPQIDGRDAEKGTIRFVGVIPDRPEWPEALWLVHNRSRHSYTLEAPSDFPLEVRVSALAKAVRAGLDQFVLRGE